MQTLDLRQRERGKSLRQGQTVTPWGIQRAACTSFSLSKPDPSLKSNTTLQSLSLSMSTGVLLPETSLNMGVGERNSGGTGPERALNRFIQSASDNKPNACLLRKKNYVLNHGRLVAPVPRGVAVSGCHGAGCQRRQYRWQHRRRRQGRRTHLLHAVLLQSSRAFLFCLGAGSTIKANGGSN